MDDRIAELESTNAALTAKVRRLKVYLAVAAVAAVALALGSGNIGRGITALLWWAVLIVVISAVVDGIRSLINRILRRKSANQKTGAPNHSTEPSPTSVTRPAGQAARQP